MKKNEIKVDTNNSPQDINREIKTLRNWNWTETPNAKTERDITIGQYVEIGDIKGFVSRYDGGNVFIEDSVQQGKLVKVEMKKFLKTFKVDKTKKDIVANISIEGPSNASNGTVLKIGQGFEPKIDAKSTKAKDQKLSNKINKISSIKSFSDLAKDFDSTTIKNSKSTISTDINGKASKKDDKIMKANTKITFVKSFSDHTDLVSNPTIGKSVKSKENEIGKNLDSGKVSKAEDNKISKKINKVKSFSELSSKIQTGPNK